MPKRVALYARVSTDDKDQDPELQLVPMREYAAARGWEAIEYVDHAPASDLRRRDAWRRFMGDAARRRVDLLLVWHLDRGFRSTLHALTTLGELEHWQVGFISLTQPEMDTTTPMGYLLFTISAALAQLERARISERVKEGMINARRKGVVIGRPKVTDRPGFIRKWPKVRDQVLAGTLSRRKAAKQLGVGQATLQRQLETEIGVPNRGMPPTV